jgi:hypothetical protein
MSSDSAGKDSPPPEPSPEPAVGGSPDSEETGTTTSGTPAQISPAATAPPSTSEPNVAAEPNPPTSAPVIRSGGGGLVLPGGKRTRNADPNTTARVALLVAGQEGEAGGILTLRVVMADGEDVGSVPFYLAFNPTVLQFDGAEEGDYLSRDGRATVFIATPSPDGATVIVGHSRLGAGDGAGGDGELCRLRFKVIGPGPAGLIFQRAKVRDSLNRIVPSVFETPLLSVP